MHLRNSICLLISIFCICRLADAQIVDDSTKVIYGTNTAKVFTQDIVYRNEVYFFDRDSMFARSFVPQKFDFKLLSHKKTIAPAKQEALQTASGIFQNDSITYFDSTNIKKAPKKKKLSPEDSAAKAYPMRFYKNHYKFFNVDTNVTNLHNFNYIYVNNNIYQNQGLIGTPSKPVFFVAPTELGYQSGYNAYDLYFTDPKNVKYYNSRSPYALIDYMANTGDENKIRIEFSRNVTRTWNIGMSYTRLNSNKQALLGAKNENYLSSNQDFIFFTSFKSKNERYHFMGNFDYFISKTNEQGGLLERNKANSNPDSSSLYAMKGPPTNIGSWPVNLVAPESKLEPYRTDGNIYSRDRRVAYHIYHQYDILKKGKLSVFHEFDRRNQQFTYQDLQAGDNYSSIPGTSFYPALRLNPDHDITVGTVTSHVNSSDSIKYNVDFAFITNKVGVKGTAGPHTWIAYAKQRNIFSGTNLTRIKADKIVTDPFNTYATWLIKDPNSRFTINEYYAGGEYIFNLGDSIMFDVKGELLFANRNQDKDSSLTHYNNQGNHFLSAVFRYKNIEAGASRIVNAPNMLFTYLNHNNFYWNNQFNSVQTNVAYINYKSNFSNRHYFEIKPSFTAIYGYTYLDQDIHPQQQMQGIYLSSLDFTYNGMIAGPLHFDLFAKYTYNSEDANPLYNSVYRIPAFYANPKVYLKYQPKRKVWRQQFLFGFDFHYRSAYYGDAYMPSISQFHLQDKFLLNDYLLIDVFLNVKIRNARLFTRFNQVNVLFTSGSATWINGNGYYISPYYASARNFLTFGVQWMLFD